MANKQWLFQQQYNEILSCAHWHPNDENVSWMNCTGHKHACSRVLRPEVISDKDRELIN
jgi:hypothetical protein